MNVKEVPQDSRVLKNTVIRDVTYAVDDEGNYTSVISEGWEVKDDALDITWNDIGERCNEIREKVLAGKISPLAYHLEKNIMSVDLLAKYTGQTKWKVKKHLQPKNFKELNNSILHKYAEALRISVEELTTV
jgi:hypothetical protein